LTEAPFPPEGEQALADGRSGSPRRVAQKPHDTRQEMECRLRPGEFPVGDRCRVGAEPVGDPALEQAEV
jgi:hypothetical protein